jgi:hypothetical protein
MLILDHEVNNPFLVGMAQFRSHLSHLLTFQMTCWNCLLFRFPVMNIDSGKTSGWFVQPCQGTRKESRGGQERRILSTFPALSWKRSVDLRRNILQVLGIRDWLWTISAPCQNSFYCFFRFQTSHFLGAFPCGPNFDSFGSQSQPHESVGSGGLSNNYCAASIHCRIVAWL